jgi:hypothetical protein
MNVSLVDNNQVRPMKLVTSYQINDPPLFAEVLGRGPASPSA